MTGMAFLFFWIGLYGLLTQVVLLRELAAVFLGHEISFGVAIAAWLLWGGAGSLQGRFTQEPGRRLAFRLGALALAAPATVILIRFSKLLIPSGSLPGLFISLVLPFIVFAAALLASGRDSLPKAPRSNAPAGSIFGRARALSPEAFLPRGSTDSIHRRWWFWRAVAWRSRFSRGDGADRVAPAFPCFSSRPASSSSPVLFR